MKELKAYVHRDRVADVVAALKDSVAWGGQGGDAHNLAAYVVRSVVSPPDGADRHYSTDLSDEIVNEYKLELICPDEEVDELVRVIAAAALTGGPMGGLDHCREPRPRATHRLTPFFFTERKHHESPRPLCLARRSREHPRLVSR